MDLSCIISSGDLDLYVLGMLPADEAEKIAKLAELFPEIAEEINRISSALIASTEDPGIGPSPGLKESVMSRLAEMNAAEDKPVPAPVIPITSAYPMTSGRSWLAAAIVVAVIFATGFIYMYQQRNAERSIAIENGNKVEALEKDLAGKDQVLQERNALLDMYRSDEFQKINLRQLPGGSFAEVQIFWSNKTKEVIMGFMFLPEPPTGKQYQLWAIVNGKPVDAGVINGTPLQKMKVFQKAEAFAITLEKQGGSPVPTMEAMVVMANT